MTKTKKAPARKKLTVEEISKMGGKATLKKYGKKHYRAISQKRWGKEQKKK